MTTALRGERISGPVAMVKAEVDPELRLAVKIRAAQQGKSIRLYLIGLIERDLGLAQGNQQTDK